MLVIQGCHIFYCDCIATANFKDSVVTDECHPQQHPLAVYGWSWATLCIWRSLVLIWAYPHVHCCGIQFDCSVRGAYYSQLQVQCTTSVRYTTITTCRICTIVGIMCTQDTSLKGIPKFSWDSPQGELKALCQQAHILALDNSTEARKYCQIYCQTLWLK